MNRLSKRVRAAKKTCAPTTHAGWKELRTVCETDPEQFHGRYTRALIYWYHQQEDAWLVYDEDQQVDAWVGWAVPDCQDVQLESAWEPWAHTLDASQAPYFRWFSGGMTNAVFSEVDCHSLDTDGQDVAVIQDSPEWDPEGDGQLGAPRSSETWTYEQLLRQSATAAVILNELGVCHGETAAFAMQSTMDQIIWIEACKRNAVLYTAVPPTVSAQSLADRVSSLKAKILITDTSMLELARHAITGFREVSQILDQLTKSSSDFYFLQDKLLPYTIAASYADCSTAVKDLISSANQSPHADNAALLRKAHKALDRVFAQKSSTLILVISPSAKPDELRDGEVWADDMTSGTLEIILRNANLANGAAFESLRGRQMVSSIWKTTSPVPVEANFPLFMVFTSGSTGKPKGVVHCHSFLAGVMLTMISSFDIQPGVDTAMVVATPGWITGQSYMIAGTLASRVSSLITTANLVSPHTYRFAGMIKHYNVNIFKAGVTFLKAVMAYPGAEDRVKLYGLSKTLNVATFCAEPVNPAVQQFGTATVAAQYLNSYWGTEHGGIILSCPLQEPIILDARTYTMPWIFAEVWVPVDDADTLSTPRVAQPDEPGEIVITKPYPYLARTLWGDREHFGSAEWVGDLDRFSSTYFSRFKYDNKKGSTAFCQGDSCMQAAESQFYMMNINGVRVGTSEIEGAILSDKTKHADSPVSNAIVVGIFHKTSGEQPVALLKVNTDKALGNDIKRRLASHVEELVGSHAIPSAFLVVPEFPETMTGKYMRRMVRALLLGQDVGDRSSLKNPESLDQIQKLWHASTSSTKSQQVSADPKVVVGKAQAAVHSVVPEEHRDPTQNPEIPFMKLGLRSVEISAMAVALSTALEKSVSPMVLYDYPTIEALQSHLSTSQVQASQVLAASSQSSESNVTVHAISCTLPGVQMHSVLSHTLATAKDTISRVPQSRWDSRTWFDPDDASKLYVDQSGFMVAGVVQMFDNEFFGIRPNEAKAMDPAQRLVLQHMTNALCQTQPQCTKSELKGKPIVVYVGSTHHDWERLLARAQSEERAGPYTSTGVASCILAGRVSFELGLTGPCMAVDTGECCRTQSMC